MNPPEWASLRNRRAVVGFDGFVDRMGRVVDRRAAGVAGGGVGVGGKGVEAVPTIERFAEMIGEAAGRSFGREVDVRREVAGGNAPNLASGLAALGVGVDLWAALGEPMAPEFAGLAGRLRSCRSIGPAGRTLALEFDDGKLMLNETAGLERLDSALAQRLLREGLREDLLSADLVGLANWSKCPGMTGFWRDVGEHLVESTHRPWVFVDLADPSGRDPADLRAALDLIESWQGPCQVVLGLNAGEAACVGRALGGTRQTAPADSAGWIAGRLSVSAVVVHTPRLAASAGRVSGGGLTVDEHQTEHEAHPAWTTGVGDRFNAGFCAGLLLGLGAQACLALGCACGGWFVRHGQDATAHDLQAILGASGRA